MYLPDNKKFCVYEHLFPNGKRYIGITSEKPNRRWGKNGKRYNQQYMKNAIKKYGWDNIQHNILYTDLDKESACNIEIELIKKFKTNDRRYGYNLSSGGEVPCVVVTEDAIKNMKKAKEKYKKPIAQYSLDGTFIKKFNSSSEAEDKTSVQASHIIQCCKGRRQSAGGYQWKYYNNNCGICSYKKNLGAIGKDRRILKKIYVYDNEWNFQKESSVYDMSIELGISQGRITQAIKNKKTYGGHKFRYI